MGRRLGAAIAAFAVILIATAAQAQEARVTAPDGTILSASYLPALPPAQAGIDYITPMFGIYLDIEPSAPSPCGTTRVLKSATPIVYDNSLFVLYVCTNVGAIETAGQTTIWRRYFRGTAPAPIPVTIAVNPAAAKTAAAPFPILYAACQAPLVPSKGGGCVPSNHPDAAK